MYKKKIISVVVMAILLLIALPTAASAWTADNFDTIEIGDYTWCNYDFNSESAVYTNTDWPISVIFWGEGAEVDAAHALLWAWTGWSQHAYYNDGGGWEWDSDGGRKSALGDGDAWHCRIYAETNGDRCTHDTWDYYVVGSSHRDYKDFPSYEYFGDTDDANAQVLMKADDTVGAENVDDDFLFTDNYEDWRKEGASEPYHVWDFDGWAEGVYME